MSALSRLLRERSASSYLAAGALLAFAFSNAPRAQCSDEVVMKVLGAGTSAPILITPKGVPVIDGDFSFRVFEAPPMEMGFLVYSAFEDATFDPTFGATIYPTPPLFSKKFITNIQGKSGPLFNTAVVTDDLCGAFATFQAIIEDAGAPGGFVVSNAVRLRVGSVTRSPLAYDALTTDGTETAGPLALGDMDEDGLRDLVSVSIGDDTAWVRPGLAGGGFGAGQKTALGTFGSNTYVVQYAEVADFDGDGFLDLVRKTGSGLGFALGNGAGVFLGELTVTLGTLSTADVADLNNDGNLDVVAARQGGSSSLHKNVWVLLGSGSGSFSSPVSYVAAVTPHLGAAADVEAVDLDEDGDLDLAVAIALREDGGNGDHFFQTSVLEGAGDGTFGSPVGYADATVVGSSDANRVASLALADFDGDTFVDVATTYEINPRVYARLGNGDLTLGQATESVVGGEPFQIAAADVDGDAIVDLLTNNTATGDVTVLLGFGDGSFTTSGHFGAFFYNRDLAVTDVDLDGTQDLLVVVKNDPAPSPNDDQILHVAGNGDGTFAGAHRYMFGSGVAVIADFDGDGANDVVTGLSGGLTFHPHNADGTFGPAMTASSLGVNVAQAAHMNGDAFIDLVVRKLTGPLSVLPGNGIGTFGPGLDVFSGTHFVLADFDGDQVLDIAANRTLTTFHVALGNGDGTFAAPVIYTTSSSFGSFAVGDVDENTTQDLVYLLGTFNPAVMMRSGNGDGTFGPEQTLVPSVAGPAGSPHLVDLDHDGDLDIVTSSTTIKSFANDGTGSFALTQSLAVPGGIVAFADMDGDGDVDVVAQSSGKGYLVLWEEPGVLGPPTAFRLGVVPGGMAIGDLDRDGMPDVAVADNCDSVGRLSIRYNQVGE